MVRYADSTDLIATYVREEGLAEGVAASLSKESALPHDVTIAMGEGGGGPEYVYATRTITFPWPFLGAVQHQLAAEGYTGERLHRGVAGGAAFVLIHEIAHALIDVLELPITGREEDAADDFAAVVVLGYSHDPDAVRATADFFHALDDRGDSAHRDVTEFMDEHSLSIQRFYSLTCRLYGADPEGHAHIAATTGMSERRLAGCPEEWARVAGNWYRIIEPHLAPTSSLR